MYSPFIGSILMQLQRIHILKVIIKISLFSKSFTQNITQWHATLYKLFTLSCKKHISSAAYKGTHYFQLISYMLRTTRQLVICACFCHGRVFYSYTAIQITRLKLIRNISEVIEGMGWLRLVFETQYMCYVVTEMLMYVVIISELIFDCV